MLRRGITKGMTALAVLLFLASPSHALDEWTKEDTAWEASYAVLHVVDWGQTLHIAKHPELYYEKNPVLGEHPSVGRVNVYFVMTLAGHIAIARVLPKKARRLWQLVWIEIETTYVAHNFSMGIRIDF